MKKRFNLLICVHAFAPSVGGVEKYVMLLASGLAKHHYFADGSVTVTTRSPRNGFNDDILPFTVIRRPGLLKWIRLIRRASVVHLAGPLFLPLILCLILRKRFVVEHHNYQAVCPNGLLFFVPEQKVCPGYFMQKRYDKCLVCLRSETHWPWPIYRLVVNFARRALCLMSKIHMGVSRYVAEKICLPNATCIDHGLPVLLEFSGCRKAATTRSLNFAYVGRFVKEKGIPILIEAAGFLKKSGAFFTLRLIGEGPERLRLKRLVQESDLASQIVFTGFLTDEALEQNLADVDALILPSIWEETAGLAVMEHMMRARAVIVSDLGGLSEIVGEAGLKFHAGDSRALFQCLKSLCDDPALAGELGRKARERALSHFTLEKMVERHAALYRKLIEGNGN